MWAGGLWAQPDFLRLWAGQTISQFGSQVTALALPLLAVGLGATPTEMGALIAAETLPFLLLGLPVGVWVDRLRRLPILIVADLGRATLLASLPLVAAFGEVGLPQLYLVAVGTGALTVPFDLAYQAYLPALIDRARLVEGNSKLEASRATAQIAGPGLAGLLVQLLAAPRTIALDALSFLLSALCLRAIRAPEPAPGGVRRGGAAELGEGLRLVFRDPILRAIVGCSATLNGFAFLQAVVYLLRATTELGLAPGIVGLLAAVGGVGALAGAFVSPALVRRYGLGATLLGGAALQVAAAALAPLAGGGALSAALVLGGGQGLFGLGLALYGINQVSLRAAVTPARLQGRMNASLRFVVTGAIPPGALLGGIVGEWLGLRATLLVGALGACLGLVWLLRSPIPALREVPPPAEPSRP